MGIGSDDRVINTYIQFSFRLNRCRHYLLNNNPWLMENQCLANDLFDERHIGRIHGVKQMGLEVASESGKHYSFTGNRRKNDLDTAANIFFAGKHFRAVPFSAKSGWEIPSCSQK